MKVDTFRLRLLGIFGAALSLLMVFPLDIVVLAASVTTYVYATRKQHKQERDEYQR